MNHQQKQIKLTFILLLSLATLSLACSSITIAVDRDSPTSEPVSSVQQVGFDFINQAPAWPEGDTAAGRHLFLHKYPIPASGFIIGAAYLNDSDSVSESFDLLVLHPDDKGWTVIYRLNLSDDIPPAKTGISVVNLPYPLPVQKNDIFAHWQYDAGGAIPLNSDDRSFDGFSAGQYGFQSSEIEVGQRIDGGGFNGQRDYFVNVIFSTDP
jgi:hypothetical protein